MKLVSEMVEVYGIDGVTAGMQEALWEILIPRETRQVCVTALRWAEAGSLRETQCDSTVESTYVQMNKKIPTILCQDRSCLCSRHNVIVLLTWFVWTHSPLALPDCVTQRHFKFVLNGLPLSDGL